MICRTVNTMQEEDEVDSKREEVKSKTRTMKRNRSIDFRLYLITDRTLFSDEESFCAGIEEALKGGVTAVQLREKDVSIRILLRMAYTLKEMTDRYHARLFVNDRVDVALSVDADGVHLGNTSMPTSAARRAAGGKLMIGVSTHSAEDAEKAEQDGADFVTLGPIFETPSKMKYGKPLGPEIVTRAHDRISIPIFAIGGVKKNNIDEIQKRGAYGIALISAILASDDIRGRSEEFVRYFV